MVAWELRTSRAVAAFATLIWASVPLLGAAVAVVDRSLTPWIIFGAVGLTQLIYAGYRFQPHVVAGESWIMRRDWVDLTNLTSVRLRPAMMFGFGTVYLQDARGRRASLPHVDVHREIRQALFSAILLAARSRRPVATNWFARKGVNGVDEARPALTWSQNTEVRRQNRRRRREYCRDRRAAAPRSWRARYTGRLLTLLGSVGLPLAITWLVVEPTVSLVAIPLAVLTWRAGWVLRRRGALPLLP